MTGPRHPGHGARPAGGRSAAVAGIALAVTACSAVAPPADSQAPPARIVLHYDFAGDWAATAGDRCEDRLDLSQEALLSIADVPDRGPSAFHVARFAALEGAEKAEALVGIVQEDGVLPLTVETAGVVDGRLVEMTLDLRLKAETARYIRLTAYTATIREPTGETAYLDLLADAARTGGSILSEAGTEGLCLKRL